jgi:predicted murein hydrolase (TIGR00659 family)
MADEKIIMKPVITLFTDQQDWYGNLLHSPLFALWLTLCAFYLGQLLYKKTKHMALLHPTITGAVLVAALLPWLELDYQDYFKGNQLLMFFLGPATVALAVPLYQQIHLIRSLWLPILVTVIIGGSFAALSAVGIAYGLGASTETLLSLAPKSITTPIAIAVVEETGGLTTLAAGAVMLTAAIGIILAPPVFKILRINDPRIWGFCIGLNAHGMGTSRAFEFNKTAGAFSSLALCLTGSYSAAVIPVVVSLLRNG